MTNKIIIRQATFDDESLIAHFFKKGFGEKNAVFKYPYRWAWIYKNNPFFHSDRFLPVWLAVDTNHIVGTACNMLLDFEVGQQVVKAGWGIDFRVLPEYMGMGLGYRLEKIKQENFNTVSLSSSLTAVSIKRKLGYLPRIGHVVYLNIKRFDPLWLYNDFMRYLKISTSSRFYKLGLNLKLHKILSKFLSTIFRFKQNKKNFNFKKHATLLDFKQVGSFNEEVTALWEQIKGRYSLAVRRDAKYLNWKFVDQPHINYQRYLVYKGGVLCGVLIFRLGKDPELPIGIISEFFTNQNTEVLQEMLAFAVTRLYRQNALMIQCSSSTDERSKILRSMGFIPIRKDLSTFSFIGKNGDALQQKAFKGDWLVGLGDHEHDEYPRISHPSLYSLVKILFGRIPGEKTIEALGNEY